jgi:cytochrome P450
MLEHTEKVSPQLHMRHAVYNVLAQFAFGKSYKIDDPEFMQLQQLNDDANRDFAAMMALDALPFAKYFIPLLKHWPLCNIPLIKRVMTLAKDWNAIRNDQIAEIRKTHVPDQTRNFTDAIIREQEAAKKEGPAEAAKLTDGHVSSIMFDFFSAGVDTTSHTLTWMCLFLVKHPEVQEKCYQSIKQTIGERPPKLTDKPNLPMVEAAILETLRLRPPVPMGLPHANIADAEIGPYRIPEDSNVIANLYAMHVDPDHWSKPLDFNPELHFLDSEGNVKKVISSYAPFGFGRRACPGEQLARNNTFLIAARLLQTAKLEPLEGVEYTIDYDLDQDFVFASLPFFVKVTERD